MTSLSNIRAIYPLAFILANIYTKLEKILFSSPLNFKLGTRNQSSIHVCCLLLLDFRTLRHIRHCLFLWVLVLVVLGRLALVLQSARRLRLLLSLTNRRRFLCSNYLHK